MDQDQPNETRATLFTNDFIASLDRCNAEGAIEILKKDLDFSEDNLTNIISAVAQNLTSYTLQHNKAAFECSSNVLMFIAENFESVLDLQDYVQNASDHVNFCAFLNALQTCLMKMQNKSKVIDWCLHSLKIYIQNLPLPNESDGDAIDRIIYTYQTVVEFLKPLVQEAIDVNSKEIKKCILGDFLFNFLIFLCGNPLCCLKKYLHEETVYKEIIDSIMTQAFCLTEDILCSLNVVSQRERKYCIYKDTCNPVLNWTRNISNIAYANFYFYVITEQHYWINVPQVYNFYYILETCAYLFKVLLNEDYAISSGLMFMENVVRRVPLHSVSSEVLELDIYTGLLQPMIKIMIYSNNEKQRKQAISIFQLYIELFNMEAKYNLISYLYETVEHSGLLSFIIGIFKSSIIQCLNSSPQNPQFLGKNMEFLLKKICNLPHGSASDMVELSDEIITALNLLRFLFIRDKNNETGIWNMIDVLKTGYLNPLREGINLCKAHWKVKAKDLEQQIKDLVKEQDYSKLMKVNMEVTLTVGGERLPVMPISQKIFICYQVINGLDVMESILIRVNECINMNDKFLKTN